jgi:hypothetical protein
MTSIIPQHSTLFRTLLLLEFLLLCVALPTSIIAFRLAPMMFSFLWTAAAICFLIYYRNYFRGFKTLWKWEAVTWSNLKPILIRWIICSFGMLAFIYFYDQERVFYLILNRPEIIIPLLFLYPVLSALPQEFIFCTYFFERYDYYFRSERAKIIASAIVFAYAHMLFINPVAPLLSLIAGFIFARTYSQTRSLALVTIEHGLYGNVLFLVGLGWYFYGGAVAFSP